MRRTTLYTLKKLLAGFLAMAILAGEIGAAQLAPVLSPALMRPPSMRPGAPVPAMPPKRAFAPAKVPARRGPSFMNALGRAAAEKAARARAAGRDFLSRPARNWEAYRSAYGGRVEEFLSRPARNLRTLRSAAAARKANARKKSPAFRVFLGEVWEGVQAVCGAVAGLLGALEYVKPEGYSVLPAPVPAAHARTSGSWMEPKPARREARTSSLDYVVPEPGPLPARSHNLPNQYVHWGMVLNLVALANQRRVGRDIFAEQFGVWTQPDRGEWRRAPGREGTMKPRFSSYYLAEPGSTDTRPQALLTFFRGYPGLIDAGPGTMYGIYTDFSRRPQALKSAVAVGDRVLLTMLDGTQKTMEIREVQELSPLVFDLDGDGRYTSGRRTRFDLDADGTPDLLNDIAPGDALLVFDADANGVSGENGKELFGDVTDMTLMGEEKGYRDGFASLSVLARRAAEDGVISSEALAAGKLGRGELKALERAYGLMAKVGSFNARPVSLEAAGITEVAVSGKAMTHVRDFDGRGNHLTRQDGAEFVRSDGTVGSYGDVWFRFVPGAFDPALAS